MEQEFAVLRDVEQRLRALAEIRRLRPMVENARDQLQTAKGKATEAAPGTVAEQQYLSEAAEASQQLAHLQGQLARIEQELRRTRYLIQLLQE